MINIEINGKQLQVPQGSMIIEAADDAGIIIPRFCYHKKLSIAANCRMCLVEVEKAPKQMPACATPVSEGMKVFTRSEKAAAAQKSVMEFLLINHPLDCPICDQGGECELQDLAMGYGSDTSFYTEGKRSVHDDDLGSLIASEMTRCIHCTRCIRFGQEIAGIRELGTTGRGEDMQITTYIKSSLKSEMSGNIIDLCPVGALTSKPYRFQARPWELIQRPSVAPHDCIGSNIEVHVRRNEVMRVVPKNNEDINEAWLSDRDRFSYCGLNSDKRLTKPIMKYQAEWKEVDWNVALDFAAEGIRKVKDSFGAEQIGAFISNSATLEEMSLLQKFMRSLGSSNIDHRVRQTDFSDQADMPDYPGLSIGLNDLEHQEQILLIGSNIQKEQPIAAHRIRKAARNKNANIFCVNPVDYDFNFSIANKIIVNPTLLPRSLAGIVKALLNNHSEDYVAEPVRKSLQDVTPDEVQKEIAASLTVGNNKMILLGSLAFNHPQAATIRILANIIAKITGASIGYLTEGSNSAGAWLAGAIPHRTAAGMELENVGLNAREMLAKPLKAYLLFNLEPECDFANPGLIKQALTDAEYVIAFSPYQSSSLLQLADLILPIAPFSETDGTYVNAEGTWQSFNAVTSPKGDAKPGWKVLRVLGNQCQLDGFSYNLCEEISEELKQQINDNKASGQESQKVNQWQAPLQLEPIHNSLTRITEWPIYRADSLVRRSLPLQQSATNEPLAVSLNHTMAKSLGFTEGQSVIVKQKIGNEKTGQTLLPIRIDNRIPNDCLSIPAGYEETADLGGSFDTVECTAADINLE